MVCTIGTQYSGAKIDLATQHSLTVTEPYAFVCKSVDVRRRDFGTETTDITETEI
jgi:hypothetical protein